MIDSKDSLAQLQDSKSNIEDLFKDLSNEIIGFKYQITVSVLLFKHKKGDIAYALDYFISVTETVIHFDKYDLDKSFQ